MYIKEKIEANKVNSPTLFIGIGGRGSDVIKGVADRAVRDDTSNIRFVVMDTDVNDLLNVDKGAEIIAIQTSSTSTVGRYLKNDRDAAENWFPENKMLEPKTVSEGAGQVRAISRLALNDIIKNGRIQELYRAIDDLFLKDGGGMKQAIRVVIAATAAGGTGSGIAMEVGMLVRHYVKKNYPEAAAMIRGFLIMPGVLDTVITAQSERDSLRCNGYATIKEINAFMMKGSGFFDTVPELHRYKDLHISIPNASSGDENISGLPFDFCFLMDRTDSNAGNMTTLPQYINYASQSIYEQCIGPMQTRASSVEDNILKLCIDPDKLGRCRFAGAGASVLKYPYEDIRDYIALNWARAGIIGSSADANLSEEDREKLLNQSWLQYDEKYKQEHKLWEENPSAGSKNEPTRAGVYTSSVEQGSDSKNGNDFSEMIWRNYIQPKIDALSSTETVRTGAKVAEKYIDALASCAAAGQIESEYALHANLCFEIAKETVSTKGYAKRFESIAAIADAAKDPRFADIVKAFTKEVFSSKVAATREDLGEHMLERYLSVRGKIVHPNAARYLLYKLLEAIDSKQKAAETIVNSFDDATLGILQSTEEEGKKDGTFEVKLTRKSETGLEDMCAACDKLGNLKMDNAIDNSGVRCNALLDQYYEEVEAFFWAVITKHICETARPTISNLITVYVVFYKSFSGKIPSIEKRKEDIVTKLAFRNGDCVRYVLGSKKCLDKIVSSVGRPSESGEEAAKLYAEIFESLRDNAYIEARRKVNPFGYERKKDIFDDIIVEYYKTSVEESCDLINVRNILHAIKLEHDVKAAIELDNTNPERREMKAAELYKENSTSKYISNLLDLCRNLASPGIKKQDNEEERGVNLVACNDAIEDGEGIRVDEFLSNATKSATISKYELRFYRAIYNIMPTQLAKMSAPSYDEAVDEFCFSSEDEQPAAGDYFKLYQSYMDRIGPDSKTSAVITPHIDKRWNAISVMPELDMDYQKRLMRKIHKAMLYGFVYDRICLCRTSDQNPDAKIYRYLNGENDTVDLTVSNGTKCDVLYEVLDTLYFDRMAVATIRNYVSRIRRKNEECGFRSYDDIEFFKNLKELRFKNVVNHAKLNVVDEQMSLFTVVLLYCNSLPVQNKDMAEMKIMVEAIIEMIYSEMQICAAGQEALLGRVADVLTDQYMCLLDNFKQHKDELRIGMFSEEVCEAIFRAICAFFSKKDMENRKQKLVAPDKY